MKTWKDILISPSTTILNSLQIIDRGTMQLALVVDEYYRLLGTVTDGDIRRGILKGISLDSPVELVMKTNPTTANINDTKESVLAIMKLKRLHQIPVLDEGGSITGMELLENLIKKDRKENWVVLMAGGLGSRLSPLTDDCPKPLLKVGSQPILETIIENFIEHGFYKFYISVNYRADMIVDYFGDGSQWGIQIKYLHEDKRLGTAGALSLIEEKPRESIIVMNGDILTKVNFERLLDFHKENNSKATMCVREYEFQVPYGVIKVDHHKLLSIEEKPVQRFFVNGGIYALEPEVLERVPIGTFYDMPTLFEKLIEQNEETSVFPIREYWLDIGRKDDFQRANNDFKEGLG
ncbi:nucleotidyltransferase family protein [Paenibacillus thalictri]|uniref:CBS domain-containing protein n=1 Tax=Paenibacillus thalictri TaxID=2527873 RepID=A0A4Q9DK77_9BACL|nr:nucleotidyltransferase family protein [Paenibacillus thalictri]TBL73010.1 CBS domain-containing protein [Paenibacillus thalictri]